MAGMKKRVKGCQIWVMGLTVMRSIKKALSMVSKLSPLVVLFKNCAVLSNTSGQNKSFLWNSLIMECMC